MLGGAPLAALRAVTRASKAAVSSDESSEKERRKSAPNTFTMRAATVTGGLCALATPDGALLDAAAAACTAAPVTWGAADWLRRPPPRNWRGLHPRKCIQLNHQIPRCDAKHAPVHLPLRQMRDIGHHAYSAWPAPQDPLQSRAQTSRDNPPSNALETPPCTHLWRCFRIRLLRGKKSTSCCRLRARQRSSLAW